LRLAEYLLECDHCGSETRVTVINSREEPYHCPMCGYESYTSLMDEEEDSDDGL
jgi:uncharacterized Zn finger protein